MRSEQWLLLLLCVTPSCAIDLGAGDTAPPTPSTPALLKDCLPFTHTLGALEGRLDAQTLPDGTPLLGAGDRLFRLARPEAACDDEFEAVFAAPLFDGSAIGVDGSVTLLAGVGAYRYFSAEGRGMGVAQWNGERNRFEALALLFTADRPRFGTAAARFGDYIYVFGGLPARFLAADVYLARAPVVGLAEPTAYEYWQGGGDWSADADLAAPILEGGTSPSVLFDAAHERWLMAYATPLAREVQIRSGLGVSGPWSRPVVLGGCRLPANDRDAFCDEVTLLPSAGADTLSLAYRVATFSAAPRAAHDYWTRLVSAAWPASLP